MVEIKYWKTAIARKKPSLPLRLVLNELHGKILDYGCGRGTDYVKILHRRQPLLAMVKKL